MDNQADRPADDKMTAVERAGVDQREKDEELARRITGANRRADPSGPDGREPLGRPRMVFFDQASDD